MHIELKFFGFGYIGAERRLRNFREELMRSQRIRCIYPYIMENMEESEDFFMTQTRSEISS